ncbi:hypothetical protein ACSBR1_039803 [Camellia fascicularis]
MFIKSSNNSGVSNPESTTIAATQTPIATPAFRAFISNISATPAFLHMVETEQVPQNTISASQMMELAKGLEDSGKSFIWVVRPPIGFDPKGEFKAEWLPDCFEERMVERKQGMLVRSWAPQLKILCHKSTEAFLSHCGWNSVLSWSQGVPIIGWPLAAE